MILFPSLKYFYVSHSRDFFKPCHVYVLTLACCGSSQHYVVSYRVLLTHLDQRLKIRFQQLRLKTDKICLRA